MPHAVKINLQISNKSHTFAFMKTIQMIFLGDAYLFLYGMNEKKEIVFRSSRNIKMLQNEPFTIDGGMLYTNLYHFPAAFLARFMKKDDE